MYKNPGKLIKRCVRGTNNIGYFVSDLIGVVVGIWAGIQLSMMTDLILVWVLGGIASAGLVAAVCCMVVWLMGLMVYTYGDIADNVEQLNVAAN